MAGKEQAELLAWGTSVQAVPLCTSFTSAK